MCSVRLFFSFNKFSFIYTDCRSHIKKKSKQKANLTEFEASLKKGIQKEIQSYNRSQPT